MNTGSRLAVVVLGLGLGLAAATANLLVPPAPVPLTGVARLNLDLSRPDALIDSARLSALPAAVIRAPLLKRLLSADFAFYYEELDTRLDVNGSLKRLAYEKDLSLSERLIDSVLDAPAEVSFWRAVGGRPGYWLLNLRRNGLEKLLEFLAPASLEDGQLSHIGDLAVAGKPVPLYALRLNNRHTLVLASQGERLVVASHPGLLLAEDGKPFGAASQVIAEMLAQGDAQTSPQARHFAAGPRAGEHRISLGADMLSFGYGRFWPGIRALRFDSAAGVWSSAVNLDPGQTANLGQLPWAALPYDAAFCTGLPLARNELAGLARELATDKGILDGFTGAVAACWYADGGWQAPVFAARLVDAQAALKIAPALAKVFGDWIGAREFRQAQGRFPVRAASPNADTMVWRREVSARYGDHAVPEVRAEAYSGARYFDVSLAVAGDTVVFSPSAARLDKALASLGRQYPAMAERLPGDRPVLMTLDPGRLGEFLRLATESALPAETEPALRRIADQRLLPRFANLTDIKPSAASLPARLPEDAPAWVGLDWLDLRAP
jgi:uncharacterized protein YfaA (DUF2138 family)